MHASRVKVRFLTALAVLAVLCSGGYAWVYFSSHRADGASESASNRAFSPGKKAAAETDALELSAKTVELAKIIVSPAIVSTRPRTLQLRGSLAIDSNRLVHVHARFPGQVVELAMVDDLNGEEQGTRVKRPLGFMDRVTKGQQLAVMWSKDLGEKKSELVDSLARLRLSRQALKRLQGLAERGGTTEKAVRDAEREVEVGEIATSRAERTLRSWMLTDEEIALVEAETERIYKHEERDREQDANWARLDISAPIDGTVVEKNVTVGDIVDTSQDLFKIADLSMLNVWLHAYEEDLPYLQKLSRPIQARIMLPSNPEMGELDGTIDRIGEIIDPNEHMALLIGAIKNSSADLRAGQFVTALVEIPPEAGVVEIPTKALVDDSNQCYVFVQPDPTVFRYERRRVSVTRRFYDVVYVRDKLTPEQRGSGLQAVHAGEEVVSNGALLLQEELRRKQTVPKADK